MTSSYQRVVLVHYHEIGLKGHNRGRFEQQLVNNIKALTNDFAIAKCERVSGRIVIFLKTETTKQEQLQLSEFVSKIPGVQRVSAGFKCDADYDVMKQLAVEALNDAGEFQTFKVQARRNHTDFEPDSMVMNREIGAVLCEAFPEKTVKMKGVDVQVNVEVIENKCFICAFSASGVGGLPVGTSGKVMCMLSSGIDSPVAAWRMAKRGAVCIGVHFSGRPQTSDASEFLVNDIACTLAKRGCMKEFFVCPIGDYQRKIALACDPKLRIVLYRRLMFRVADALGNECGAKAVVTGESLGQVASQTMENMIATSDASQKMVLRPLIGMDKLEIINEAQKIGTFEISSQDASDCCTLFMPKSPETHADLSYVKAQEEAFPFEDWVEEIVKNAELRHV